MKSARVSKTALKAALLLAVILTIFVLIYVFVNRWTQSAFAAPTASESGTDVSEEHGEGAIFYDGRWYVPKEGLSTLLIIGVDAFGKAESSGSYNSGGQADFLMLAVLDKETKSYALLHLNRDTMTEIDALGVDGKIAGTTNGQIALAHAYGTGLEDSCENTVRAVSRLLYGVAIDDYVSVTMDAVSTLNDLVGGVTVTVEDDFSGVDDTLVKGETVCLNGSQALTYVRTRMGMEDSTNLARMNRQKQYVSALIEKLVSSLRKDDAFSIKVLESIADYMVTDCSVSALSEKLSMFCEYDSEGLVSPEGTAEKGDDYMEFYPDEDALKSLVLELFYTEQE